MWCLYKPEFVLKYGRSGRSGEYVMCNVYRYLLYSIKILICFRGHWYKSTSASAPMPDYDSLKRRRTKMHKYIETSTSVPRSWVPDLFLSHSFLSVVKRAKLKGRLRLIPMTPLQELEIGSLIPILSLFVCEWVVVWVGWPLRFWDLDHRTRCEWPLWYYF